MAHARRLGGRIGPVQRPPVFLFFVRGDVDLVGLSLKNAQWDGAGHSRGGIADPNHNRHNETGEVRRWPEPELEKWEPKE